MVSSAIVGQPRTSAIARVQAHRCSARPAGSECGWEACALPMCVSLASATAPHKWCSIALKSLFRATSKVSSDHSCKHNNMNRFVATAPLCHVSATTVYRPHSHARAVYLVCLLETRFGDRGDFAKHGLGSRWGVKTGSAVCDQGR